MQIVYGILNLLILVGVVVVPMAALFYGSAAIGWGFRQYPKSTFAVMVLLFLGLVVAALAFERIFPGCHNEMIGLRNMVHCDH
jgi:hypothetical protein